MTTTIKVSDELCGRLEAQAADCGLTLGDHLLRLADAEDWRRRLASPIGVACGSGCGYSGEPPAESR